MEAEMFAIGCLSDRLVSACSRSRTKVAMHASLQVVQNCASDILASTSGLVLEFPPFLHGKVLWMIGRCDYSSSPQYAWTSIATVFNDLCDIKIQALLHQSQTQLMHASKEALGVWRVGS